MIIILIILSILFIGGIVWQIADDFEPFGFLLSSISGFVLFIVLLFAIKWQVSSQTLTGYIYQRHEKWGYVSYSLRFSQNAGTDEQPSFCTKAGTKQDEQISQYVGTDTKVQISTPPKHFRIVNNPFECNSFSYLDKIIEEK